MTAWYYLGKTLKMSCRLGLGHRIVKTLIRPSHRSDKLDPYENTNESLKGLGIELEDGHRRPFWDVHGWSKKLKLLMGYVCSNHKH